MMDVDASRLTFVRRHVGKRALPTEENKKDYGEMNPVIDREG